MKINQKHLKIGFGVIIAILFIAAFLYNGVQTATEAIELSEEFAPIEELETISQEEFDSMTVELLDTAQRELVVTAEHLMQSIIVSYHAHDEGGQRPSMDSIPCSVTFAPKLLAVELDTVDFDKVRYNSNHAQEEWNFEVYDEYYETWFTQAYIIHNKIDERWQVCIYIPNDGAEFYGSHKQEVMDFYNWAKRTRIHDGTDRPVQHATNN